MQHLLSEPDASSEKPGYCSAVHLLRFPSVSSGHRFGDAKGRGRKKVSAKSAMASLIYFGKTDKPSKKKVAKKPKFDHSPHEVCLNSYSSCGNPFWVNV